MKYIPSLDGFRAFSVILVLLAHAGLSHVIPGGLGVTIFFFLSGYLITSLLLREWKRSGTIHIGHFYLRRFLRLAPPLFLTLAIAYTWVALDWLGGGATVNGALAQVFYMANYYNIFWNGGHSIPDGTGVLWSLAVEEHYYLIYPFVMLALLRLNLSTRRIALLFFAICLLVLCWRMFLVSQPGFTPARTFYATDTRIDAIMWGAILSLWLDPMHALTAVHQNADVKKLIPPSPSLVQWGLFIAGIGMVLSTLLIRSPWMRETIRYSLQGIALMPIFYLAIRYCEHPVFQPMNWKWVRTLGVYSYAIYLSHYVIMHMIEHVWHVPVSGIFNWQYFSILLIGSVLPSVLYAAMIERYLEGPLRQLRARFH